jgi:hypothetical protein
MESCSKLPCPRMRCFQRDRRLNLSAGHVMENANGPAHGTFTLTLLLVLHIQCADLVLARTACATILCQCMAAQVFDMMDDAQVVALGMDDTPAAPSL